MAVDKNITKSLLLKKDLPPVTSANQHVVRYRVISENLNKVSAWSSIYYVDSYPIPSTATSITNLSIASGTVTVTTASAHGISVGETVTFSSTISPFAAVTGAQIVLTVPTINTFTVLIGSSTVSSAATTGIVTSIIVNKVNIVSGGGSWSVTWKDTDFREKYDIFVKFDNAASYSYHGTASVGNAITKVTTYTFPNTGTTNVRVTIQPEGILKTQNNSLKLFESVLTTVA
jgi:hypothetical protein